MVNLVRVLVPHTEDGIDVRVLAALDAQGAEAVSVLTPRRDRFAYADALRRAWTGSSDLIICEADVVPAPGSIQRLHCCREPWCSHPLWTGERYDERTLGLCRFSAALQRDLPDLMHQIAAPVDPRYWVRRGWTRIPADCGVQTLNTYGRRATLLPEAPMSAVSMTAAKRPTTHDSLGLDVAIAVRLDQFGVPCHVHPQIPHHLHDYDAPNPEVQRPWHQVRREEVDWPTD